MKEKKLARLVTTRGEIVGYIGERDKETWLCFEVYIHHFDTYNGDNKTFESYSQCTRWVKDNRKELKVVVKGKEEVTG